MPIDRYSLKHWALDAAERAIKTAAQAALALLTADHVIGILDVDWAQLGSITALAALVSVLTSIASAGIGNPDTASLDRAPELIDLHAEDDQHDDGDPR